MGAPEHAEQIGAPEFSHQFDGGRKCPRIHCQGCDWVGYYDELLGVDPDEDTLLWCPQCESIGWEFL